LLLTYFFGKNTRTIFPCVKRHSSSSLDTTLSHYALQIIAVNLAFNITLAIFHESLPVTLSTEGHSPQMLSFASIKDKFLANEIPF